MSEQIYVSVTEKSFIFERNYEMCLIDTMSINFGVNCGKQ